MNTTKALLLALLASTCITLTAHAVVKNWINPAGGLFEVSANWNTPSIPGPSDRARFPEDAVYDVLFGPAPTITTDQLRIRRGTVTFQFSPMHFSYVVLNDADVSHLEADTATLRLRSGTLQVGEINVGVSNGPGLVNLAGSFASLDVTNAIELGCPSGTGRLEIMNGALVQCGAGAVGYGLMPGEAATSSALVDGSGSTWIVDGSLSVAAPVTVSNGGVIECGAFLLIPPDGELAGDGTAESDTNVMDALNGAVFNAGFVAPSLSSAPLTLIGDYVQTPPAPAFPGALVIPAAGGAGPQAANGALSVTGDVELGGLLVIELVGAPPPASPLVIVEAGQLGVENPTFDVALMPELAAGDFLDVAYDFPTPGDVSVISGALAVLFGGFFEQTLIALPGTPTDVAFGSFDGLDGSSGIDAVVTVDGTPGAVVIFLNTGEGSSFVQSQTITVGNNPSGVAVADLDGDGAPDLAVSCASEVDIILNTNDGQGTFGPAMPVLPFGGGDYADVGAGDFDEDALGTIDLVVTSQLDDNVYVLANTGGATFPAGMPIPGPTWSLPDEVDPQDVDNDKDMDIVLTAEQEVAVIALEGGAPVSIMDLPLRATPSALTVTDLDLNGLPDVAATSTDEGTIAVILQESPGTFKTATRVFIEGLDAPTSITSLDMDDDGDADLAVVVNDEALGSVVQVLRNDTSDASEGQLLLVPTDVLADGDSPVLVGTSDLDGDGADDLVIVGSTTAAAATAPTGAGTSIEAAHAGDWAVGPTNAFRAYLTSAPSGLCPADITGPTPGEPDGNVDALDFLLLIGQWGSPCTGPCGADITGPTPLISDGNVDSLDFLLLISQWGTPGNCA